MWSSPSPDGSTQYCLIKNPNSPSLGMQCQVSLAFLELTSLSKKNGHSSYYDIFLFLPWAEQHYYSCRLPFYIYMGLWSPADREKQKPKSHFCLSLHYCPWQSQCENPPEAPWGVCNFSIETWMYVQAAQFCLRKKSLVYLLNGAKWNHVFDR